MKDDFEILNNFMGFGNPNAKFLFIGVEEALDFSNIDSILKLNSTKYIPFEKNSINFDLIKYGKKYTKVYDIMSKIIAPLIKQGNWVDYRNNFLLQNNGNEFQMNLFPLGNKNIKTWNNKYSSRFGFINKSDYLAYVRETRFKLLFEYSKVMNPTVTICFGTTFTNDFISALNLNQNSIQKESCFTFFPENKTIITPFFDYRFLGHNRIKLLIEIIKPLINISNESEKIVPVNEKIIYEFKDDKLEKLCE